MTKSFIDPSSIGASHLPIMSGGIVIVTLLVVVCVGNFWTGALAHAEVQLGGMSNSIDVLGKPVKTFEGKVVGTIKDLVINWRSDGYIEYAVLSCGGFWGLGVEYFAVPWEALTPSDHKEHFVLNVKEEHLHDAPGFVVYRFYDRSSAAVLRAGRSTAAQSADAMKGDIGSDVKVSAARSLPMQHLIEAEFHR